MYLYTEGRIAEVATARCYCRQLTEGKLDHDRPVAVVDDAVSVLWAA